MSNNNNQTFDINEILKHIENIANDIIEKDNEAKAFIKDLNTTLEEQTVILNKQSEIIDARGEKLRQQLKALDELRDRISND